MFPFRWWVTHADLEGERDPSSGSVFAIHECDIRPDLRLLWTLVSSPGGWREVGEDRGDLRALWGASGGNPRAVASSEPSLWWVGVVAAFFPEFHQYAELFCVSVTILEKGNPVKTWLPSSLAFYKKRVIEAVSAVLLFRDTHRLTIRIERGFSVGFVRRLADGWLLQLKRYKWDLEEKQYNFNSEQKRVFTQRVWKHEFKRICTLCLLRHYLQ